MPFFSVCPRIYNNNNNNHNNNNNISLEYGWCTSPSIPNPKKIMSNRQKSSNTDKYVHPSDRQISSITKQVISHITDLTNPTKEKKAIFK